MRDMVKTLFGHETFMVQYDNSRESGVESRGSGGYKLGGIKKEKIAAPRAADTIIKYAT